VDDIEDGKFTAPPPGRLAKKISNISATRQPTFAHVHCQNCDARYSCRSFQTFKRTQIRRARGQKPTAIRVEGDEHDLDEWIEANLSDD
jgi:hypothetical protein